MNNSIKGTVLVKIDRMFKIDFIALNESKMIQLQFATSRLKIGPLEPEIHPVKSAWRRYVGPVTSRDVISLKTSNNITCNTYNYFLTVEDYTKETQKISDAQLPYKLCESRMFVIYSSTRDVRWLCNYLLSCKVAFFTFESFHRSQFWR